MSDQETIENLLAGDQQTVREFFFVRCRPMLVYIGQYFCRDRQTPEELIGEFYEFLSADDWHKLRIFKFECPLNSYVAIIASRYFQRKRNRELLPLDEDIAVNLQEDRSPDRFFMEDLGRIVTGLQPFDRFLVQRILMDGEKPGDILDEAKTILKSESNLSTDARSEAQFAGYVYTRYNRVRKSLQKQMTALGYGNSSLAGKVIVR